MRKKVIFSKAMFLGKVLLILVASLVFTSGAALAATSTTALSDGSTDGTATGKVYELLKGSSYQQGCVAPCMCLVLNVGPLTGTFYLEPLKPSPLYNRFSLTDIHWTVLDYAGTPVHTIEGVGFYEIGGDFALTQQMVLHLSIDGAKAQVFDSGVVPADTPFPGISIEVSDGKDCFRTWLIINAAPKL